MIKLPGKMVLKPGSPDFLDLPWHLPIQEWEGVCDRLENAPRGLSRHPVVFVNFDGQLYALKELPEGVAEKEYSLLDEIAAHHLPSVYPVGYANLVRGQISSGVLITRFLEGALPYRMLFMNRGLKTYRRFLLDAISGLLVQLHLAGVFWGDCSLSNTLFRRDAGALQAYLVDAETAELYPDGMSAPLRYHDLEIMEENINGDLLDLHIRGELNSDQATIPIAHTGSYIRSRYLRLWEEITREDIIFPDEHYRIQDRIRALNELGFSVGNVELAKTENGDQLRLRVVVTDRNFHRDQLHTLTGLDVEELQATKMMNEIQEVKATLSQEHNRSTPLSVAAYHWLDNYYYPVTTQLERFINKSLTTAEIYCQVLEHKWFLSERVHQDVGHQAATNDFLEKFSMSDAQ
ncbi:MAG TPA: DUF4032 domain-containing protein [Anaerolineales bacterium]|nr:DUF4032 domain-containing protein [Anaerolineales bacterium]